MSRRRTATVAALALAAALIAGFLALRVPDSDPAAMRAKYGSPPSRFVTLPGGLRVHLRDEGPRDAPVLVLLHGSNSDLHTWQPWVERLGQGRRLVRYDQRGHGLTGPAPDGDYSQAAFARDLEAVARALGLTRFAVAGNSMGGGIAARYALMHPDRVSALILIDAAGAPVKRTGGGNLAFTLARLPVVSTLAMEIMPRAVIAKSLRQSVARPAIVTPAAIDRYWELARYPGNRAATLRRFALPLPQFTPNEMARVRAPTLVLWGRQDALLPVAGADWFARAIPGARAIVYEGTGHLPMEEEPAATARDAAAFLDRAAAAQGTAAGAARSMPKPGAS